MSNPQVPLPQLPPVGEGNPAPPLNVTNIQGDIIAGLPKRVQLFEFFQIVKVDKFRDRLKDLIPLITTLDDVKEQNTKIQNSKADAKAKGIPPPLIELVGTNIAFSAAGIGNLKLSFKPEDLREARFTRGQARDAPTLNDDISKWDGLFRQEGIDGVILITADREHTASIRKLAIDAIFRGSIRILKVIEGKVRPGDQKGHEHFGFNDGLSQPAIRGFDLKPFAGQQEIPSGVILLGGPGDTRTEEFAKDGSFLVFRKLAQLVPEFDDWLDSNSKDIKGGAELLGARVVGRWKSGTPIDKAPFHDIPEIAKDPNQVNDFQYTSRYPDSIQDQTRCPFSAHLRKTNPRGDVHKNGLNAGDEEALAIRRIIRQGITFGPEVTEEEKKNKKSSSSPKLERGLLFVSYQSSIANGFAFIQQLWANNPGFPFEKKGFSDQRLIGLDPLIGQERPDDTPLTRVATGLSPDDHTKEFRFPEFVTTRGGEYFFSPSIFALDNIFSNQGTN